MATLLERGEPEFGWERIKHFLRLSGLAQQCYSCFEQRKVSATSRVTNRR